MRSTLSLPLLLLLLASTASAAPTNAPRGHRMVRYYGSGSHRVRVTPLDVKASKSSAHQNVAIHLRTLNGQHFGHIVYGDVKLVQQSGSSALGALGQRLAPSYEVRGKHTGSVIAKWSPSKGLSLTSDFVREANHNVPDARSPHARFRNIGLSDIKRLGEALRGSAVELREVNAYTYDPKNNRRANRHALLPDGHL